MSEEILKKHWKVVEIQLQQASELLNDPNKYKIKKRDLEEYKNYTDNNEFQLAMEELAEIVIEYGCRPVFWRSLKKVADQMKLENKVDEYENQFQKAFNSLS